MVTRIHVLKKQHSKNFSSSYLSKKIKKTTIQVHSFIIIDQIYSTYDSPWFKEQATIKKEREKGEGSVLLPQHRGIRICDQQGYHQST